MSRLATLNELRKSADRLMKLARDCRTLAAVALAEMREQEAEDRRSTKPAKRK